MTPPKWTEEKAREAIKAWAHGVLLRDDIKEFEVLNHEDLARQVAAAIEEAEARFRSFGDAITAAYTKARDAGLEEAAEIVERCWCNGGAIETVCDLSHVVRESENRKCGLPHADIDWEKNPACPGCGATRRSVSAEASHEP